MPDYGLLLPTRKVTFSSPDETALTSQTQAEILQLSKRAEALGFESVWIGDSVLSKHRHEPLVALAAIAGATDGIGIGTGVYLPHLRHPVHVAHQTATLDLVSQGRFEFGIGVGSGADAEDEHATLGVPYARRGDVVDEALEVVTDLWSGEPVDYQGEFFELREASIGLTPTRTPPIHVASGTFDIERGFPKPIRNRLREHDRQWIPIHMSLDQIEAGIRRLEEFGGDGDVYCSYYQDVVIAPTEEAGLAQAQAFFDRYYPSWETMTYDELREHGVYGPPERVRESIQAYTDAGVDRVIVRFPTTNQFEQLGRFSRDVLL